MMTYKNSTETITDNVAKLLQFLDQLLLLIRRHPCKYSRLDCKPFDQFGVVIADNSPAFARDC